MSIDADSIICSNCSFTTSNTYRLISLSYEIDGESFETGCDYGWCYQCNTISDIEPEFNVNDIKRELHELKADPVYKKNFFSKIFSKTAYTEVQAKVYKLELQYKIVSSRLSPRRCLQCGGDQVKEIVSFEGDFFKHQCGGNLSILSNSEYESPVRFMYKKEIINLSIDGIRKDKSNYPKKINIVEPAEFLLADIYQQTIDGNFQIQEFFKNDLKYQVDDLDFDELAFFSLTVLTYLILRFSKLHLKVQLLDDLAIIFINDLNQAYVDDHKKELIIVYQTRYAEYTKLIEIFFAPELSTSGNPSITLALHLYEMVTEQSSKGKMLEIIYLSKLLSEHIVEQIHYIETKLGSR